MCFGGNVGVYDTLGVKLATFHQTGRKDTKKNFPIPGFKS